MLGTTDADLLRSVTAPARPAEAVTRDQPLGAIPDAETGSGRIDEPGLEVLTVS